MKKRKTYEVSVINKTYSKTYSDETKFYTSDTALELNFQLKEVEYDFDSAEIILLNVDDRSLATRPVVKSAEGFTYELEDDVTAHYGEWKGQLKFNEGGEIYVSSPVVFRIENDLNNDRPPQLTDIRDWETLRQSAKDLIVELGDVVANEAARIEAENQRVEGYQEIRNIVDNFEIGENAVGTENIKDNAVSEDKTTFFTPNPDAMLESTTWVNGYVGTDGKVASAQNNRASDFIAIQSNTDYMIEVDANTGGVVMAYLGYYDVDKVFIERISIGQSYYVNGGFRLFNPPTNAKFIRVSFPVDHYLKFYIHEGTTQQPRAIPYLFNYEQETLSLDDVNLAVTRIIGDLQLNHSQPDFIEMVNTHNSSTKKLQVRNGSGILNVFQPLTNGKWAEYTFQRNGNDDFILFQSLFLNDPLPDTFGFTRTHRLVEGSNKEFAFRGRPLGSTSEIRFFPEHEGIGTAFANSQTIYVDGVEYDFTRESHALYTEHEQVTIIQDMNLVFPGEPEPLARLVLHQTVNSEGVTYQGEIEFLRDMEIERGYVGMFPKTWEGFTKLKLSTGQEILTNQSHELDEVIGIPTSMAYVNDSSTYPDNAVVLAQTITNPNESLRVGQDGVRTPNVMWLQHRTTTIDKVYPHVFDNHIMRAGEKYKFGAKMNVGLVPFADSFI